MITFLNMWIGQFSLENKGKGYVLLSPGIPLQSLSIFPMKRKKEHPHTSSAGSPCETKVLKERRIAIESIPTIASKSAKTTKPPPKYEEEEEQNNQNPDPAKTSAEEVRICAHRAPPFPIPPFFVRVWERSLHGLDTCP